MSKFICYGMKNGEDIDTLQRVTEEELIKAKINCGNYSEKTKGKYIMVVKPFEGLKRIKPYKTGDNYSWGLFYKLGNHDITYFLIFGYNLESVENAKKLLLEGYKKNTGYNKRNVIIRNDGVKIDKFVKELDKAHISNTVIEKGKNLIIEVEGDWKHDLLASEKIAERCGLVLIDKKQKGKTDSDWGTIRYKYSMIKQ